MRNPLVDILPVKPESIPFYGLYRVSLDVLAVLIVLLCVVGVVRLIRTPPLQWTRFQRMCRRNRLENELGERPILRVVRRDKSKPHGRIYELNNMGITITALEAKKEAIGTGLGVKISGIELGKRSTRTRLYALPLKYATPTIIGLENAALCKELCKLPNLLCVGATGSGKSYALKSLLGIFVRHIPDVSITVGDYKKSSFAHFADTPGFFGYENVPDGIRAFYAEFSERLAANDEGRNQRVRFLLLDEYAAMLAAQDKKVADELRTMVANMLFMGRSLGMRILIGVQRADAEWFKNGARDQFHAILGLGNLSPEQRQMLFPDDKQGMTERNGLGEGYLRIDGHEVERIRVAVIRDFDALNDTIRTAMCH